MKLIAIIRFLFSAFLLYAMLDHVLKRAFWDTNTITVNLILYGICLPYIIYQTAQGLHDWRLVVQRPGKILRVYSIVFVGLIFTGLVLAVLTGLATPMVSFRSLIFIPALILLAVADLIMFSKSSTRKRDQSKLPIDQLPDDY